MKLLRRLFKRSSEAPAPKRVAIRAGSVITEVGAASILHGLFSTISANLEPAGWGSRFPYTMHSLYRGELQPSDCASALRELKEIDEELSQLPVSQVVWDIDEPTSPPSPYYHLGAGASNAAEFFVTVNGLNLLRRGLIDSLESAVEFGHPINIITFSSPADMFVGRA